MLLDELNRLLAESDVVPLNFLADILDQNAFGELPTTERAIATEIDAEIGAFLPRHLLTRFISAELSDLEASQISSERKRSLKRSVTLLPTLIGIFAVSNDDKLEHLLRRLEECCSDFPTIISLPHQKKARREARESISSIINFVSDLSSALDKAGGHIDIDFSHHLKAAAKNYTYSAIHHEHFRIFDLREVLSHISFSARLVLLKDDIGDDPIYIIDNKAKTHIVETIYQTSLFHGRPALVTTPGSDFSHACSILYEIASGEQDVSLAGAINRFSRSAERKRIDIEEEKFRWDESEEGMKAREADNFAHIKGAIAKSRSEQDYWIDMWAKGKWEDADKRHFAIRMLDAEDELKKLTQTHGPFLVWASQYSQSERLSWRLEMEEAEKKSLERAVRLGRMRRAGRT